MHFIHVLLKKLCYNNYSPQAQCRIRIIVKYSIPSLGVVMLLAAVPAFAVLLAGVVTTVVESSVVVEVL